METDPDLPLLRQIATGDHDALETLYQRHGLKLLNFLIGWLGDRTTAEDALQNTMLAVWQGAKAFRAESLVKTWLFAIARRQAEKVRHHLPISTLLEEKLTQPDESSRSDDPISAHTLQMALRRLSTVEKEALELVYYREMTITEAAAHLRIPPNTLKSRLIRARTNLRRWLVQIEVDHETDHA